MDESLREIQKIVDRVESVMAGAVADLTTALKEAEEAGHTNVLVAFFDLKNGYEAIDTQRKKVYAIKDHYDKVVVPKTLDSMGADKISVAEIGQSFYTVTRYSASIKNKETGYDWLRENGGSALISETVNAGTLAAWLKDFVLDRGQEPPEDVVKFTSYATTGMSRYTPKT